MLGRVHGTQVVISAARHSLLARRDRSKNGCHCMQLVRLSAASLVPARLLLTAKEYQSWVAA